jgi:hypothetical protein
MQRHEAALLIQKRMHRYWSVAGRLLPPINGALYIDLTRISEPSICKGIRAVQRHK